MPPSHRATDARGPPSTLLFDLDDTLFDHSGIVEDSLRAVAGRYPALSRRRFDELRTEYNTRLNAYHPQIMRGEITPEESRIDRFRVLFASCGATLREEELQEASHIYRATYQRLYRPVPGAEELLRHLRAMPSVRIGIVSNNTTAEQTAKLRAIGFEGLFDQLVVSEEVGVSKPDPEIFHTALRRIGGAAEDAVMVGDSWEADIVGARAAGIRPVWFNRYRLPGPTSDPVASLAAWLPTAQSSTVILGAERVSASL
jgi:5'-nucleotidase